MRICSRASRFMVDRLIVTAKERNQQYREIDASALNEADINNHLRAIHKPEEGYELEKPITVD